MSPGGTIPRVRLRDRLARADGAASPSAERPEPGSAPTRADGADSGDDAGPRLPTTADMDQVESEARVTNQTSDSAGPEHADSADSADSRNQTSRSGKTRARKEP